MRGVPGSAGERPSGEPGVHDAIRGTEMSLELRVIGASSVVLVVEGASGCGVGIFLTGAPTAGGSCHCITAVADYSVAKRMCE